jgi:oligoribonuclease
MPSASDKHLIWLDLEMTGLDPDRDVIIEMAMIATDWDLTLLAEGPVVAVHQPEALLQLMDAWCWKTHGGSGLVDRVRASDIDTAEAARLATEFALQWVPPGKTPLCGNSIPHDRRFLKRYMPAYDAVFHYRNIDVSTVKELVRRWYPDAVRPPMKAGRHQALDDIRESIEELRWYRENVFRPAVPPT